MCDKAEDGESVLSETPDYVSVEGGSYAFGTDEFYSKIFLTNKRLLFLIATQVDLKKVNNEVKNTGFFGLLEKASYGKEKKDAKIMINTWMEVPLNAIRKIDTPSSLLNSNKSQLVIEFDTENKKGVLGLFKKNPRIVCHLDNRDIWKANIVRTLQDHRVKVAKSVEGSGYDEIGRRVCGICGTHYHSNEVKIVQCQGCNRFVCKERLEGTLSKKWVKTDCFDDDNFLCKACSKKLEKENMKNENANKKSKVCKSCGAKIKGKFCSKCGESA